MERVDFEIVTADKRCRKRSSLSDEEWAQIYPVAAWKINDFVYRLMSEDVVDVFVLWRGSKIRIKNKEWGRCRFFCHNHGRAVMGREVPEWLGVTFGVIFIDKKVIMKCLFDRGGHIRTSGERYENVNVVV